MPPSVFLDLNTNETFTNITITGTVSLDGSTGTTGTVAIGGSPASWSASPTLTRLGLGATAPTIGHGIATFAGAVTDINNIDGLLVTFDTVVTGNGSNDNFGISSQLTNHTIAAGVTESGSRVAITGDAYASTAAFAGTLANQTGLRGRAGLTSAVTAGSVVTNAYGGYFEIQNGKAGATITNSYGVYIANSDTVGTTTNRYGLYVSGDAATTKNVLSGKTGFGISPSYRIDIATAVANDRAINIDQSGGGTAAYGLVSTVYGSATTNYGVISNVTGGGTNYSFYSTAGNIFNAGRIAAGGLTADPAGLVGTPIVTGGPTQRKVGAIAAQTIGSYTVGASDGSFEISANINVTTATAHSFTVTCAYTNESNVSQTITLGFNQLSGAVFITAITNVTGVNSYESPVIHIRAKAATTITIATTGTFTTVVYNGEGMIKQIS